MYLITILAFAVLFWQADAPPSGMIVPQGDVFRTLLIVGLHPPLLALVAWLLARRSQAMLSGKPGNSHAAQLAHHRATLSLRVATLLAFAASVFLTNWVALMNVSRGSPWLRIVGDILVLAPFLITIIAVWIAQFPLERKLRFVSDNDGTVAGFPPWTLRTYLDFNFRHHVLIVAVPLTIILFASNVLRGYEKQLQQWSGWVFMPDALLGISAVGVFVSAPLMLTRIWRTIPLEQGTLRERLESICRLQGMKYNDIVVWPSAGMLINAAVMGIIAPVRYILLSDGLISAMSNEQIEAVFGHEIGHIRHRHMQHFLVFAFVGWLIIAGLMEVLARAALNPNVPVALSLLSIQAIGVVLTLVLWGVGFGWISRRFERQADRFGAWCVTPSAENCSLPCSVHGVDRPIDEEKVRVCVTGASIFTSALNRVAQLNGIPHEERSWRHSSIGSRIRFLTSLAGDPTRAMKFDRMVRRTKMGMMVLAILGSGICMYYWNETRVPAMVRLQAGSP
jgi:STE24 endopeptidase